MRALTAEQLDGCACIRCGRVFGPGSMSAPAEVAETSGQVFACSTWGCDIEGVRE